MAFRVLYPYAGQDVGTAEGTGTGTASGVPFIEKLYARANGVGWRIFYCASALIQTSGAALLTSRGITGVQTDTKDVGGQP
jgi:hypothetical protein